MRSANLRCCQAIVVDGMYPDISEQHVFVTFCGLRLEQVFSRLIGNEFKNSEWS